MFHLNRELYLQECIHMSLLARISHVSRDKKYAENLVTRRNVMLFAQVFPSKFISIASQYRYFEISYRINKKLGFVWNQTKNTKQTFTLNTNSQE